MKYSLGDFEHSEQSEGSEGRQSEAARPLVEVDPEDLEDRAHNDDAVEAVERGLHESSHAQRVHPDAHLEDEGAQKQELGVIWKRKKI